MKPRIRIASPADAKAIHAVYEYYIQHTVVTFNEVNKPVEAHAREIETLLETYPYLAAENESGSFLGFACAEPIRPQTGYRYGVELTIYLCPDTPRRCGVGRLLYQTLLDCLTRQGIRTAYGIVSGTNESSLALHRHFGFTEAARFSNVGYKHGRWLDAVWMQKTLNPYDASPAPVIPFSRLRGELEARFQPFCQEQRDGEARV